MSAYVNILKETVAFIQQLYTTPVKIGIVLGSGLGNLVNDIQIEKEIAYEDIPHFPVSTVKGHSGKMIFGELGGKKIVAMSGRFHYYEGYTPLEVTFPIRVMKLLGVENLMLSNAAGSVNPEFKVGDLIAINDHVSFFQSNPLIGKNIDELGTRFPDMSEPYSKALLKIAHQVASEKNHILKEGIYVGVTGPTFETHAEYRLIKALGGDLVGMSTVQECIVANHAGMKVLGISVVTDEGIRESDNKITHEEVLEAAKSAEPKLAAIFKGVTERL